MKSLFFKLPEYALIVMVLLAGYSPPYFINPLVVAVIGVLILQIIYKNRILGLGLGILFLLANLFFLGALLSEFSEFTTFNSGAQQLLLGGLPIWIVNMVLSITMIYKYAIENPRAGNQLKLEKQKV